MCHFKPAQAPRLVGLLVFAWLGIRLTLTMIFWTPLLPCSQDWVASDEVGGRLLLQCSQQHLQRSRLHLSTCDEPKRRLHSWRSKLPGHAWACLRRHCCAA